MLELLKTDPDLRKSLFESISAPSAEKTEASAQKSPKKEGSVSAKDKLNLSQKNILARTPMREPLEEQYLMSKQINMALELNDSL
jgi:hypothetical protein